MQTTQIINQKKRTVRRQSSPKKPAAQPSTVLLLKRAIEAPAQLKPTDILHLQRTVGNQAVQRMLADAGVQVQRHPSHAEEEEVQGKFLDGGPVAQRHPSHAEEEEVQGKPDGRRLTPPVVQRGLGSWLKGAGKSVGRGLRRLAPFGLGVKSREKKLSQKYGIVIGSQGEGDTHFSHGMLDKINKVLGMLPRSHVAGNAALQQIVAGHKIPQEEGGQAYASASAYDPTSRRIEINRPPLGRVKMPYWLYLTLNKGWQWQRKMMDEGAMADFHVSPEQDQALGLGDKGEREVMAGVSNVLAQENLVSWTIRHEMGHGVDAQIKWTEKRGHLPQFGGWKQYEGDEIREVAKAFVQKAGITAPMYSANLMVGETYLDRYTNNLSKEKNEENITGLDRLASPYWAKRLKEQWNKTELETQARMDEASRIGKIALSHPWTFSDGGGEDLTYDGRIYHRDHYGTWVSYLAAARANALSNYQFSSPGEWFAEAYAAYYDPKPDSPARARIPEAARNWFAHNLGPPPTSRREARGTRGDLANDEGQLQPLQDLDEEISEALANPDQMANVDIDDLPDDLKTEVGRLAGF